MSAGTYRNITGNLALSYGLIAGSVQSGLPIFLGLLPDHPGLRHPPRAEQAQVVRRHHVPGRGRDRRRRAAAIGASFAGSLGVTTTSGPGIALKSETIGLAVMTELPLLVVDVQRGGPSTGLPTKTEQADLLQAMFGRNGESPVPIVAPAVARRLLRRRPRGRPDRGHLPHPRDAALRRHARQRLRAVADPRARRAARDRPRASRPRPTTPRPTRPGTTSGEFWPYLRDEETLARPWAIPGTPGLEHRIGGLEKGDGHGNISYDPANHDFMVRTRQAKVDRIADSLPPARGRRPHGSGQGARARLGIDVRPDRCRRTPRPQGRLPRRPGPPAPPQPVPQGPRRDPRPLRQGAGARDEPRPALDAAAGDATSSTRSATTRSRACRSRRPSSPRRSASWSAPSRGHRGRPHPQHRPATKEAIK